MRAVKLGLAIMISAGAFGLCAPVRAADTLTQLKQGFSSPPDEARIMMRWWWFGPAVEKTQLEREMRLMKEGGIGGFEIQPVYPLELDDPAYGIRNFEFLSPEFLDALGFTAQKAKELGLRMDLTLGSGWPYGGPKIPITEAAGQLRVVRVKLAATTRRVPLPALGAGEKLIAAFLVKIEGGTLRPGSEKELAVPPQGALMLEQAPSEGQEVQFFISSRTGMMVKRPAIGAEGFVLDHYDRKALDTFLKTIGEPSMKPLANNPPYAVFCDSLEVFSSDWTADFLDEFRRRRGYDLRPLLPLLATGSAADAAAVRHDWGKTLTELVNDRFLKPLHEWARAHNTRLRAQVYGIPPATVSSNAFVDLSEGEGSQWKVVRASRWASSASHIYGRSVTSSETWTWLHSPVFRATPLDMKAEADIHFLQGINQLIGHGWPYTPPSVPYPGWRFYAAAVFNEKNPWWIVMPDVTKYLQRLSYLFRQGQPVNDVALYLPTSDAWSHFTPGRVHMIETLREMIGVELMPQILDSGYNLDFFDDDALASAGGVSGNSLRLGQNRYRVVILPGVQTIPVATMRKLEEFVRNGGILIATRRIPESAPGRMASDSEKAEVSAIARRLFEGPSAPARLVQSDKELGPALRSLLVPDVAVTPQNGEIGTLHRRTPYAEIYFLANTGNAPVSIEAAFRVTGVNPELWDPFTGEFTPLPVAGRDANATRIAFHLEPYGSRVVVFSKEAAPAKPAPPSSTVQIADLSSNWKVTFGEGGESKTMAQLRSWTEQDETRYYSGVAIYEKQAEIPAQVLAGGARIKLDFGEGSPSERVVGRGGPGMRALLDPPVREAAVVYVNGQRAGSLWCPPYMLDITKLVKPGANQLRIVVANLALNHMAGQSLPEYRLLRLRYGNRFDPQDMNLVQPQPSGLLGPVKLIAEQGGAR